MLTQASNTGRRSRRTLNGRRSDDVRRSIGEQIQRLRLDAGISQRALAAAAGIQQSFLSKIERGLAWPSIPVLVVIGSLLGADLSVRLYPNTGPSIRDRLQAPMVEALLQGLHPNCRHFVEVPVWRPARGVIDLVVAIPSQVIVSTEFHSQIHRLEQQLRWSVEKAESLPSSEAWPVLSAGRTGVPISRLLVLRNSSPKRQLAREFEATIRSAYPARSEAATAALRDPAVPWPGAAVLWADVAGSKARILDHPPRGVRLGR